jgi:hypothetical protein
MRRSRPWSLWALGGVLWALVVLLGLELLLPAITAPYAHRRVACVLCGARETRTEYGPIVFARTPMASVGDGWWEGVALPEHEHDWHTFGCVQGIGMVACTMTYENEVFLGTLPRFRDQNLAREVALRLASMSPEDRGREVRDSPPLNWISVLVNPDGHHPHLSPVDQQAESYGRWRSAHPLWNDLFPPTLSELEARH